MTKAEILKRVRHGYSWQPLRGSDVASVSKDMRRITLRHVWLKTENEDVKKAVQRALMEYAQEIVDATGTFVEVYSKQGYLLDRVASCHEAGTRGVTCTSRAHFVAALPPPYAPNGRICVSETVRRDLRLATIADLLPADAKFWVRDPSGSFVISVELFAWVGAVLADDYATTVMDTLRSLVEKRREGLVVQFEIKKPQERGNVLVPPQDARLAPGVNGALALVKDIVDRRIAEVMATEPANYYGPIQYQQDISFPRLIAAAERGIRLEVDPEHAAFLHRAGGAAARLGRRVVRSICGEGGLDLSSEQDLVKLVQLDAEACGRPVSYNRSLGSWEVEKGAPHKSIRPCGNSNCAVSSGIHEGLMFGRGTLDFNGFWSKPCAICARTYEQLHPEAAPCWPFEDKDTLPEAPPEVQP